jgi:mannan endo-1,6-alpha-mannosidase
LNVTNFTTADIIQATKTVAQGLYSYYNVDSTAGSFNQPNPWQWWESGAGWNAIINYQIYTNDTTYQSDVLAALANNLGPDNDMSPTAQQSWEANDDQSYWLFPILTAMEANFPALPSPAPAYADIAANGFQDFVDRWNADSGTCGGGLKWQYTTTVAGYYYKNAVSNGGFFQTAARLARYTGNSTYADWANKIWDWSTSVGLVSSDFHVYDGAGDQGTANCATLDKHEWTYNIGSYMHGAAHMYAYTKSLSSPPSGTPDWESRVQSLVGTAQATFFSPFSNATNVMYEAACETVGTCSVDETSFKASLAQWLGKTSVLVPSTSSTIYPLLLSSATAAAATCSGLGNNTCSLRWYGDSWDGQNAFGVQLSALEVIQSLLASEAPAMGVKSAMKQAMTALASTDSLPKSG